MRCLILGGDGMLGHQLLRCWRERHEVYVTLRRPLLEYARFGLFTQQCAYDGVDVRDTAVLRRILEALRPEAVINAVGLIKQRPDAREILPCLEINAVFPHRLRLLCQEVGARLVHVSTDCVFSGRSGGYTEEDRPDPEDLYGHSKLLGEVAEHPAVTLRSSIIGLELSHKTSLVEWFLAQRGTIPGYTRAMYTGLTTCEMARLMEMILLDLPHLCGVWHVASSPISKFDLLTKLARLLCRRDLEIVPDDSFCCDRSLCGDAFTQQTGYKTPSWDQMLAELADEIITEGHLHAAA
jgi:dTDP-4-dehydrorhamnose reductase